MKCALRSSGDIIRYMLKADDNPIYEDVTLRNST